jgi:hypothetical protein
MPSCHSCEQDRRALSPEFGSSRSIPCHKIPTLLSLATDAVIANVKYVDGFSTLPEHLAADVFLVRAQFLKNHCCSHNRFLHALLASVSLCLTMMMHPRLLLATQIHSLLLGVGVLVRNSFRTQAVAMRSITSRHKAFVHLCRHSTLCRYL